MKSSEGILPPTEGVAAGATSLERDLEFLGPHTSGISQAL